MNNYFYFNKGQRRGILLMLVIIAAIVMFRWVL
jgi:hypothetical protein